MTQMLDITRMDFAALIDTLHLTHGVEVGVAYGEFSYYLLKHSSLQCLWSVDSWLGRQQRYRSNAISALSEFGDRSKIVHTTSMRAARIARRQGIQFDFIYIDASHILEDVKRDLRAWFPRLKRPGIFAGHDYIDGVRDVQVIPAVNQLAKRIRSPVYRTRETWASWFFLLGSDI